MPTIDPPVALSAILGDAVHNLRATFDLLASEIVHLGGGDRASAQFPVNRKLKSFEANIPKMIHKAPLDAVDVVRSLQPYQGGDNEILWALHRLDIRDKHRMIIPVGSAYQSVGVDFGVGSDQIWEKLGVPVEDRPVLPRLALRLADRQFPLQAGNVLFTAGGPKDKMDHNPQFTFAVAFGEGEVVKGEPIIPTLNQFAQFTASAVKLFERVFPV